MNLRRILKKTPSKGKDEENFFRGHFFLDRAGMRQRVMIAIDLLTKAPHRRRADHGHRLYLSSPVVGTLTPTPSWPPSRSPTPLWKPKGGIFS
jgi:hypothetical protein